MSTAEAPPSARRLLRPITACVILCAMLPVSGYARAQQSERGLVPVTPGTQDAAPLRRDMMVQPMDLRLPVGFDRVYRDRGGSDMYYRIGGGVTAKFPRSVYYSTPGGTVTGIPPGTVFMIGPPPGSADPFAYIQPSFEDWQGGPAVGGARIDPRLLAGRRGGSPQSDAHAMAVLGRAGSSRPEHADDRHPLLARDRRAGDTDPDGTGVGENDDTENPIFAGELTRSVRIGELLGREPAERD